MSLNRLAAYLKKRRAATKLSLRDVAERAGLDHGFLARVEGATYQDLGVDTLRKIAQGYGVPFETLLIEAGYVEGEAPDVPELHTYLRTHMGLNEDAVKEVESFIEYARKKYGRRSRS